MHDKTFQTCQDHLELISCTFLGMFLTYVINRLLSRIPKVICWSQGSVLAEGPPLSLEKKPRYRKILTIAESRSSQMYFPSICCHSALKVNSLAFQSLVSSVRPYMLRIVVNVIMFASGLKLFYWSRAEFPAANAYEL